MPEGRSYGDILRNERELSGYDLTSMASRLHIRPDILQAIENADFDKMPARGYSKNMVRAYARALRIDEQTITSMYLDEINRYELGYLGDVPRSRNQSSSRSLRSETLPRRTSSRREATDVRSRQRRERTATSASLLDQSSARAADRGSRRSGQRGRAPEGRRLPDNRMRPQRQGDTQRSRGKRDNSARRGDTRGTAVAGLGSLVSSIGGSRRSRADGRVPRSLSTIGANPSYARGGQSARGSAANINLTVLLAAVAIVIVVIIAVVIISTSGKNAAQEVPSIPISGLTDTSSPEDENQVSAIEVAPTDVTVEYSIPTGQSAWMEIYENGSADPKLADVVKGPASETFTVTGTLTIRTANPDGVTVTVDGQQVKLTKGSDSNYYSYTVDFPAILQQWREEHNSSVSSAANSATSPPSSGTSEPQQGGNINSNSV